MVFDDAPEWRVIEALVPQGGLGLCLITSRNPHWDLADDVTEVDAFDVDTAVAFLRAQTGTNDTAGARELALALGGLALASSRPALLGPLLSADGLRRLPPGSAQARAAGL